MLSDSIHNRLRDCIIHMSIDNKYHSDMEKSPQCHNMMIGSERSYSVFTAKDSRGIIHM